MPLPNRIVKMLRADLAAASIDYRDVSDRVIDFHALRHTTGSLLAASGTHPKVAQHLLRHSKVDLTLSRYSHVYTGQASDAIAALPDLSQPSEQKAKATGTDNRIVDTKRPTIKNRARFEAFSGAQQCTNTHNDTQAICDKDSKTPKTKAAAGFEPANNGFANRRLRPLGYAAIETP